MLLAAVPLAAQAPRLPFGIETRQLAGVRIILRAESTKPGGGFEQIVVHGDGAVSMSTLADAWKGRVPPAAVQRLLELLRHEGIEGWDDAYEAGSNHYAAKILSIELRGVMKKQVIMARPAFPEFAHAVGAVKLVAAQACPEAFRGKFLQRL